jgi:hypothetical protein
MSPAETATLIDQQIGIRQEAAMKRRNEHILRIAEDAKKTLDTIIRDCTEGCQPRYVGHLLTKVKDMQTQVDEINGIRNLY